MRRYLLDTSILAALLNNRRSVTKLATPWMHTHKAATSILCYGEVIEYIKSETNFATKHQTLKNLLGEIYPYFLTHRILERYADLRRQLRPPHGPGLIGDIDTLIAATALERNLTLVTTDTDFKRIKNLKIHLIDRKSLTNQD